MRSVTIALMVVLCSALGGCGGGSNAALPASQHQGFMNELPGKKGYFEIRAKNDSSGGRPSRSRKAVENSIEVHFYGPDGATELSPAPTDVTVKVGAGDTARIVTLAPKSQGGFASAPGHYPAGFRGQLSAKIDGETLEASFLIR